MSLFDKIEAVLEYLLSSAKTLVVGILCILIILFGLWFLIRLMLIALGLAE